MGRMLIISVLIVSAVLGFRQPPSVTGRTRSPLHMKRSPAPAIDIDHQPGHYIRRLHQISVGIFLQELGEIGITPVQYAALQTVANHPGIDQRTLARTIALDASTTGGVVDRLEARGWLERKTAPEDRRARQLALTEDGVQLLREAVPAMLGAQELILEPLTERQREQFMKLLRLLVDTNNAHSRAPSEAMK
jgi:MarR family transcriptional regulator, lower aerobic nicotinate degradation pathway regulator